MTGAPAALAGWMEQRGIARLSVVSPHLDDAVYSLAAMLARPDLPPRKVFTVFTAAGPMTDQGFARATGFADAEEEHACRRGEDQRAMARLGLPFEHCGIESGRSDDALAALVAGRVLEGPAPDRHVVLLPLGAGAALHPVRKALCRVLRRPPGAPAHGEHVLVRDQMRARLRPAGVHVGYYAELPYQWANGAGDLARLAERLIGGATAPFRIVPDPDAKLAVAKEYESQTALILGTRPGYQRRVVGIPERVFLPAG